MPLLCSLIPIHLPSQTRPPNLLPPSILTHTLSPHSRTSLRFGFLPNMASYGVIPLTALVEVLFISQTMWCAASPHRILRRPLAWSRAQIHSTIVQLWCSAIPFWEAVSCMVSFWSVPCFFKYNMNSLSRYSPPQSECMILMFASSWVLHKALYSCKWQRYHFWHI